MSAAITDAITYEELRQWRNICEWLAAHHGYAHAETLIHALGQSIEPLVSPDRTQRQALWEAYKIQFIIWERESRSVGYWKLKGNWEFKIDFLEQVVLRGKHPDALPKTWLVKWEQKQQLEVLKQWERDECIPVLQDSL